MHLTMYTHYVLRSKYGPKKNIPWYLGKCRPQLKYLQQNFGNYVTAFWRYFKWAMYSPLFFAYFFFSCINISCYKNYLPNSNELVMFYGVYVEIFCFCKVLIFWWTTDYLELNLTDIQSIFVIFVCWVIVIHNM